MLFWHTLRLGVVAWLQGCKNGRKSALPSLPPCDWVTWIEPATWMEGCGTKNCEWPYMVYMLLAKPCKHFLCSWWERKRQQNCWTMLHIFLVFDVKVWRVWQKGNRGQLRAFLASFQFFLIAKFIFSALLWSKLSKPCKDRSLHTTMLTTRLCGNGFISNHHQLLETASPPASASASAGGKGEVGNSADHCKHYEAWEGMLRGAPLRVRATTPTQTILPPVHGIAILTGPSGPNKWFITPPVKHNPTNLLFVADLL
jgi:hypothetical protein